MGPMRSEFRIYDEEWATSVRAKILNCIVTGKDPILVAGPEILSAYTDEKVGFVFTNEDRVWKD
jgi:hypothetical protein